MKLTTIACNDFKILLSKCEKIFSLKLQKEKQNNMNKLNVTNLIKMIHM